MTLEFNEGINILTGKNGVGKTTILEAIHSLLFGKAYFSSQDRLNLKTDCPFFRAETKVKNSKGDVQHIVLKVQENKPKSLELDGKKVGRLSSYIGNFLTVCIAPEDILLVNGHSSDRRNFLDQCIAQFDKEYTRSLSQYNKAVKQRNALLKQFVKKEYYNEELLLSLDRKLIEFAPSIYQKRKSFIEEFAQYFQEAYNDIAPEEEKVNLNYETKLSSHTIEELLTEYRAKDRASQRSNVGIHKDELGMELNDRVLKSYGSQGQIKSFVVALKFAEFKFLLEKTGKVPVFIMDDMFDKLDGTRAEKIMFYLHEKWNAQIFLSDTDKERIANFFEKRDTAFQHIHILPSQEIEYVHV